MMTWLKRIRGALGMGLVWAIGGAAIGGFIELLLNIFPGLGGLHVIDMWPQTLAIPGFVGGLFFAVVLGLAGARHKSEYMSMRQFAVWGAAAGLMFGAFLLFTGFMHGLIPQFWLRALLFVAPVTLLSTAGAAMSYKLARMGDKPALSPSGEQLLK
jgi:hypothetical protein